MRTFTLPIPVFAPNAADNFGISSLNFVANSQFSLVTLGLVTDEN